MISAIEKSIYTQLAPLIAAGVRVRFLPEKSAEIGDPTEKGWVSIYLNSLTTQRLSLNNASSEFLLKYQLEIQSLQLRKEVNSIYGIIELLSKYLNGFRPRTTDSLKLKSFQRQPSRGNFWIFSGEFEVIAVGQRTQAGQTNPDLGGNPQTIILDSNYDTTEYSLGGE